MLPATSTLPPATLLPSAAQPASPSPSPWHLRAGFLAGSVAAPAAVRACWQTARRRMGSVQAPASGAGGWDVATADKEGVGVERLLEVAQRAADAAGEVLRMYFRQRVEIIDKEDQSPVTIADREAEEAMMSVILKSFPAHAVFGEENGWRCVEKSSDYVWVLDPIDGTKSFITGKPLFGTLIALLHKGKPVMGIIDQPILRERWVGMEGKKTTLNGQEISVRPCNVLAQAYLYTTSPHLFAGDAEDAFIRVRDKPYDFLSLVPVIEGAGGSITDWKGDKLHWPVSPESLPPSFNVVAAGDARVHKQAIDVLQGH
ncbi:hypothetical protein GUJ93_ZPchr0001g32763 [Zizania palustris]|uniref:Histidinol-phosphatase n=1 Tax=Zizania palustris TaxID=103762 RepID=A0A8J5RMJ0_ZIZPA|nr:hypothetical protein GUJ93_ZPchr0001g32763 [Zizania palustris]